MRMQTSRRSLRSTWKLVSSFSEENLVSKQRVTFYFCIIYLRFRDPEVKIVAVDLQDMAPLEGVLQIKVYLLLYPETES